MIAAVRRLVAAVRRARHAVIAVRSRPRLATGHRVARLRTVAPQTVIARTIHRSVIAAVRRLVAAVRRARHAVIAVRSRPRLATGHRVARLRTVAPQTVIARTIHRSVIAGVRRLVAAVRRARHAVIAVRSRPRLATGHRVARLRTVAPQTVIARTIHRSVIAVCPSSRCSCPSCTPRRHRSSEPSQAGNRPPGRTSPHRCTTDRHRTHHSPERDRSCPSSRCSCPSCTPRRHRSSEPSQAGNRPPGRTSPHRCTTDRHRTHHSPERDRGCPSSRCSCPSCTPRRHRSSEPSQAGNRPPGRTSPHRCTTDRHRTHHSPERDRGCPSSRCSCPSCTPRRHRSSEPSQAGNRPPGRTSPHRCTTDRHRTHHSPERDRRLSVVSLQLSVVHATPSSQFGAVPGWQPATGSHVSAPLHHRPSSHAPFTGA